MYTNIPTLTHTHTQTHCHFRDNSLQPIKGLGDADGLNLGQDGTHSLHRLAEHLHLTVVNGTLQRLVSQAVHRLVEIVQQNVQRFPDTEFKHRGHSSNKAKRYCLSLTANVTCGLTHCCQLSHPALSLSFNKMKTGI